jgi:DNA polymerase (family 10)
LAIVLQERAARERLGAMKNSDITALLEEAADLLEFRGANPFRVRAYRNAARAILEAADSATSILADPERRLTEIAGIGADLAEKIAAICQTGSFPLLVELRGQVPQSVLALMRIPGLGPKKAAVLHKELKIQSLDELRAACVAQQVRGLKGFGAKTEQTILAGIALASSSQERLLWAEADEWAQRILAHLRSAPNIEQLEAAGSYRRGRETIGDLDFLAVSSQPREIMEHLSTFADLAEITGRGDTKMSLRLATGLQVDLRVVPGESFGAALLYFTGSKDHNVVLRGRAKDRGLKINEYGVFRDDRYLAGRTEAEIYSALDLPWFPPELREARREFEWADAGALPPLIELGDIQGDLHMHPTESDGHASLESRWPMDSMARACASNGARSIGSTRRCGG